MLSFSTLNFYVLLHLINASKIDFVYRLPLRLQFFLLVVLRPNEGHGFLILEVFRCHTTTHHSR